MKIALPLLALSLLLAPAAMAAWMPHDVAAYADRRKQCNHWGGEEGYDKARTAEINRAAAKLGCDALDADEKLLLRRYRSSPGLQQQIRSARDALF
jgi:hypothetical protein